MATLRLQNVPDEIYELLRARARSNRRSISAETLSLLEGVLPTASEVHRRAAFYQRVKRLRSRTAGPSAEELLHDDRQR